MPQLRSNKFQMSNFIMTSWSVNWWSATQCAVVRGLCRHLANTIWTKVSVTALISCRNYPITTQWIQNLSFEVLSSKYNFTQRFVLRAQEDDNVYSLVNLTGLLNVEIYVGKQKLFFRETVFIMSRRLLCIVGCWYFCVRSSCRLVILNIRRGLVECLLYMLAEYHFISISCCRSVLNNIVLQSRLILVLSLYMQLQASCTQIVKGER